MWEEVSDVMAELHLKQPLPSEVTQSAFSN